MNGCPSWTSLRILALSFHIRSSRWDERAQQRQKAALNALLERQKGRVLLHKSTELNHMLKQIPWHQWHQWHISLPLKPKDHLQICPNGTSANWNPLSAQQARHLQWFSYHLGTSWIHKSHTRNEIWMLLFCGVGQGAEKAAQFCKFFSFLCGWGKNMRPKLV